MHNCNNRDCVESLQPLVIGLVNQIKNKVDVLHPTLSKEERIEAIVHVLTCVTGRAAIYLHEDLTQSKSVVAGFIGDFLREVTVFFVEDGFIKKNFTVISGGADKG